VLSYASPGRGPQLLQLGHEPLLRLISEILQQILELAAPEERAKGEGWLSCASSTAASCNCRAPPSHQLLRMAAPPQQLM